MPTLHKALITGAVALAAIVLIAAFQRHVAHVPLIGQYLPR